MKNVRQYVYHSEKLNDQIHVEAGATCRDC